MIARKTKNRRPRRGFGSPDGAHARNARRAAVNAVESARGAEQALAQGDCKTAFYQLRDGYEVAETAVGESIHQNDEALRAQAREARRAVDAASAAFVQSCLRPQKKPGAVTRAAEALRKRFSR